MEMTNEIKAIAPYLGQRLKCVGGVFHPNQNSKNEEGKLILSPSMLADFHEGTFKHGDFKLILKPLSAITDEDKESLYHISCEEAKYDYTQDFGTIRECIEHWIKKEGNNTLFKTYKRYQFLLSKGYDLPNYYLDGKTLFEAGLAIYE